MSTSLGLQSQLELGTMIFTSSYRSIVIPFLFLFMIFHHQLSDTWLERRKQRWSLSSHVGKVVHKFYTNTFQCMLIISRVLSLFETRVLSLTCELFVYTSQLLSTRNYQKLWLVSCHKSTTFIIQALNKYSRQRLRTSSSSLHFEWIPSTISRHLQRNPLPRTAPCQTSWTMISTMCSSYVKIFKYPWIQQNQDFRHKCWPGSQLLKWLYWRYEMTHYYNVVNL